MAKFIKLQDFHGNLSADVTPQADDARHFNVFKIEDLAIPRENGNTKNYSRRDYYKVSIVSGHSKIHYADRCIEVTDHALVFTNPLVPYHWERISEQQTGFICLFTEAFFSQFAAIREYPVFQSAEQAVILLSTDERDLYSAAFTKMYTELQGSYRYKYDLLRGLLMEVIHGAQKKQPEAGVLLTDTGAYDRITALFIELLERQFPIEQGNERIKIITPSAFAAQLNIHVNHLNKVLKETTSQTTTQFIDARLVQEAKVLLKHTNLSIKEIAWALGYEEPNHFSTFFKSRTGVTPKQFRQPVD